MGCGPLQRSTSGNDDIDFLMNVSKPDVPDELVAWISSASTSKDVPVWEGVEFHDDGRVRDIDFEHWGLHISLREMTPVFGANIECINLSRNQHVEGNINVFVVCPNLIILNLSETQISGGIEVLGTFRSLEEIRLKETRVFGDINVFLGLPKLIEADLFNCFFGITGDIENILTCARLQYLDCSHTHVQGNMNGFNCSSLKCLCVNATDVTGELQSFENCGNLQILKLHAKNVAGDLCVFGRSTGLFVLDLSGSATTGDIRFLKRSRSITDISLKYTDVHGSLSSFKSLVMLRDIDLSWTRVEGDIEMFRNCVHLEKVSLQFSAVYGDISAFSETSVLAEVNLNNCNNITGNVVVFGSCRDLTICRLGETGAYGDVAVFARCLNLQELVVHGNSCTGDNRMLQKELPLCEMHFSKHSYKYGVPEDSAWESSVKFVCADT
eukprot:CAMPEP_0185747860 /NCGR_PEP_ID=MMETSP1174-20130828/6504_1 /TAXON_ID=35687 /ORGANISM="Dictyocha speculum, Strain CCMP1381" /LENGTH=439 /DNA_ID=CAMNT_0028423241 /DNA_START=56 /DNA_END=1375 /DNA_ORIENTATION=+